MTKRNLKEAAKELGIKIVNAKHPKDAQCVGIHLLNPSVDELADAVNVAERDMFPRIVIHNSKTWPQAKAA